MDHSKHEQDEDQQFFLPKTSEEDIGFSEEGPPKAISALQKQFRLILEVAMALVIVFLSVRPFPSTKTVKPTPVSACMFLSYESNIT
jgi:hypothetical protein